MSAGAGIITQAMPQAVSWSQCCCGMHTGDKTEVIAVGWCKGTLAKNVTFTSPALSHHRSYCPHHSMHGDEYSKWFLGFATSQLALPFWILELHMISHFVRSLHGLLSAGTSPILSACFTCGHAIAEQCGRGWLLACTWGNFTKFGHFSVVA